MQTNEENVRLERVLVIFYLIFTGLGLTCERIHWYYLCTIENLTINGFHWTILNSLFQIAFLLVVYIGKEKLSRAWVWSIWSYYLLFGVFELFSRGQYVYKSWKDSMLPNYHFSDDFWFATIKGIVIAILVLIAELLIITKYRNKKVLITQIIIFGVLFIHNSFGVYGREMRMMRFEQPYNYYASLQSYCSQISTFLFLFWLYVKKDPKPKKEETLVFADGHWRCASCGEVIKENNVFCAMCGKKVR